ncbi:TolC family protein [Desulforamulus ruminis]|uniref:TolC family protein n=1 Tax=Desulforamulus ruminis TaxID=1564 RepID=UPI0023559B05|nr:TolC family protein [Desulforamulus ruminis]
MKKIFILAASFCMLFWSVTFANAETATQNLSLDDAIQRAFTFNTQIRITEKEIDKQDYLVKRSGNEVRYSPIDEGYNPKDLSTLSTHEQNLFNLRKGERQLEADKRQVILDTKTAYYNVLKAQKNLEVSQINYKNSQLILLQAESKHKVGLTTNADLLNVQSKVEADKAAITEKQGIVDEAYTNLNKLVSFPIDTRPVLTDRITFEEVDFDPFSKANLAAEMSYEVWSAEEAARVAERMRIFATYYTVANYNVDQATETARDTRETIKKQTRSLVLGLDTLKSKYDQLNTQLIEAQEKLKVAKANMAVGMVTKDAVQATELGVVQTEAALMEVASQYNITADTILKLTGELPSDPKKMLANGK